MATAAEYDQFYRNLGLALCQWQQVEVSLFDVFHQISGNPDRHVASAIYFAVVNFEGKIAMTDTGAKIALEGGPFIDEWVRLAGRVKTNQRLRNHLVHFQLCEETTRHEDAQYRLRLIPNFWDAM